MTPGDLARRLAQLGNELATRSNDILLVAAVRGLAFYKRRIFNDGLASDGGRIGRYSPQHKATRQSIGRQIDYVDLQLTGELFESIQAGKKSDSVVIEVKNRENLSKARENEARFKKRIFDLSQNEIDQIEKGIGLEIEQIIRRYL